MRAICWVRKMWSSRSWSRNQRGATMKVFRKLAKAVLSLWLPLLFTLAALPWAIPPYHAIFYNQSHLMAPLIILGGVPGYYVIDAYSKIIEPFRHGTTIYWIAQIGYLFIAWIGGWATQIVVNFGLKKRQRHGNISLFAVLSLLGVNFLCGGLATLTAARFIQRPESCVYSISPNHAVQFKTFAAPVFESFSHHVFILTTTNSGKSWQQQDYYHPGSFARRLCANAHHLDDQTIWTWDTFKVYSSSDGGKTWVVRELTENGNWEIRQIYFQDDMHGQAIIRTQSWVHASAVKYFITEDGGKTWNSSPE